MKIKISYKFTGGMYWAEGWDGTKLEFACSSESFTVAKARLIKKIKETMDKKEVKVPEPEEVEI